MTNVVISWPPEGQLSGCEVVNRERLCGTCLWLLQFLGLADPLQKYWHNLALFGLMLVCFYTGISSHSGHPESGPSGGHEITTLVMKFITFFHDHGPHSHDHVTSFHDQLLQILFIVQFYSSGHEMTSSVMNGILRSICGTIFFSGHEIIF